MIEPLSWQIEATTLILKGVLHRDTLLLLWQQYETITQQTNTIDISALSLVDSAGLALLVHMRQHIQQQRTAQFSGISDKLFSLISLYNLQHFFVPSDKNENKEC